MPEPRIVIPGDVRGEKDTRPSIFVAMPTLGQMRAENALNLISWFVASRKYKMGFMPGIGNIPHDRARNILAEAFIESQKEFDYILWLDSRTVPSVDSLDKLLEANVDMVSATAQTIKNTVDPNHRTLVPTSFRWDEDAKMFKTHVGVGLEEVDVTHVACTLIKREVMENVSRPWFSFEFSDKNGTVLVGEEFSFCRRVKEAGYRIYNRYDLVAHHFIEVDSALLNHMIVKAHNGAVLATYDAMKASVPEDGAKKVLDNQLW